MDRDIFINICNSKLRLVRAEYGYNQLKMAHILGISKKTLVEIEKERSSLGWTGSVALCAIFRNSEILAGAFGNDSSELFVSLALEGEEPEYKSTFGGHVWWQNITSDDEHTIQQNIISQHYRLLTSDGKRIMSSFDIEDLLAIFEKGKRGEK